MPQAQLAPRQPVSRNPSVVPQMAKVTMHGI